MWFEVTIVIAPSVNALLVYLCESKYYSTRDSAQNSIQFTMILRPVRSNENFKPQQILYLGVKKKESGDQRKSTSFHKHSCNFRTLSLHLTQGTVRTEKELCMLSRNSTTYIFI